MNIDNSESLCPVCIDQYTDQQQIPYGETLCETCLLVFDIEKHLAEMRSEVQASRESFSDKIIKQRDQLLEHIDLFAKFLTEISNKI